MVAGSCRTCPREETTIIFFPLSSLMVSHWFPSCLTLWIIPGQHSLRIAGQLIHPGPLKKRSIGGFTGPEGAAGDTRVATCPVDKRASSPVSDSIPDLR